VCSPRSQDEGLEDVDSDAGNVNEESLNKKSIQDLNRSMSPDRKRKYNVESIPSENIHHQ